MTLIKKFAAYIEKNKVALTTNQQATIIEGNTLITAHYPKADAVYIVLSGNYASMFLLVKEAPKIKNDGTHMSIRLFGRTLDYHKYVEMWMNAARKRPGEQWFYVPKTGSIRKMNIASAEWAIHNINSQNRMVYLEL